MTYKLAKQQIHAYVDSDIYILLKADKMNLSNTINECLKALYQAKGNQLDEELLESELTALKEEQSKVAKEIAKKSAMVAAAREVTARAAKERQEQMDLAYEAARLNNPLRDA